MLKKTLVLGLGLIAGLAQAAALENLQEMNIWPNKVAPGSEKVTIKQETVERSKRADQKDRAVMKITAPALTVYKPAKANGVGILVTPGGSYQRVVLDKEGSDLAVPFNEAGVTLFVLTYRLPGDGHDNGKDVPLADAQRALRLIRANAAEWGLKPDRIGVMGFSAGGHVAASLATGFARKVYDRQDAMDDLSARPDFAVLGYPVITMKEPAVHKGSRKELIGDHPSSELIEAYSMEAQVSSATPPTFIFHADDDTSVLPENSILFYQGLKKAKVPANLHIFPSGKHGFGIRGAEGLPAAIWPRLTVDWLASVGLLK
jgi:acetyl esterase/lipase